MSANFAEFNHVLQKFAEETGKKVNIVTKESAFRIYRGITAHTAVGNWKTWESQRPPYKGYKGGRLRESLTINEGQPDFSVKPISASYKKPKPKLPPLKSENPIIYIVNNLPYADRVLMRGWSAQTPKNMAENEVLKEYKKLESGNGI